MKFRTFRGMAVVLAAVALGTLALATPASAASTTTTAPRSKALTAYRSCMKAHGVKLPQFTRPAGGGSGGAGGSTNAGASGEAGGGGTGRSGGGGGRFGGGNFVPRNLPKGVTLKKYQAAQKACASKLPAGGFGSGQQNAPQFQAYLSCLRDHGVKVPTTGSLRSLNRNDPAFQAANQTCGVLLPSRPGSGATPTTSATST
jgi:hypothetical protein